jgi:hypothetical protein
MAGAGAVFWGAVVGSVACEMVGRALGRRRASADEEDEDDAGDHASAGATLRRQEQQDGNEAAMAAARGLDNHDDDRESNDSSTTTRARRADPQESKAAEHRHGRQRPPHHHLASRLLRRALLPCAVAAGACAAARRCARGQSLLPDLGEALALVPSLLPSSLSSRGRSKRGSGKQKGGKKDGGGNGNAGGGCSDGALLPPNLASGKIRGHVPLVELVRFKERQWYLEELDDSRGGDANAMVRLARMRLHGQGCPASVAAAAEWVRRARALGAAATLEEVVATDSPDPRAAVLRRAREEEARRADLGGRIGRAMAAARGGGHGGSATDGGER